MAESSVEDAVADNMVDKDIHSDFILIRAFYSLFQQARFFNSCIN